MVDKLNSEILRPQNSHQQIMESFFDLNIKDLLVMPELKIPSTLHKLAVKDIESTAADGKEKYEVLSEGMGGKIMIKGGIGKGDNPETLIGGQAGEEIAFQHIIQMFRKPVITFFHTHPIYRLGNFNERVKWQGEQIKVPLSSYIKNSKKVVFLDKKDFLLWSKLKNSSFSNNDLPSILRNQRYYGSALLGSEWGLLLMINANVKFNIPFLSPGMQYDQQIDNYGKLYLEIVMTTAEKFAKGEFINIKLEREKIINSLVNICRLSGWSLFGNDDYENNRLNNFMINRE